MVEIKAKPRIEILTRRKVLHHTISEIAWKVSQSNSTQKIIRLGVLENEYIQSISMQLINRDKKIVAEFKIDIDWEKHQINALKEDGDRFEINKNKSIAEQILSVSKNLSQIIDDAKTHYTGSSINVAYTYKKEIYLDEEKLKKIRKLFGTSPSKDKWAEKKEELWDIEINYCPEDLSELNISSRFKK